MLPVTSAVQTFKPHVSKTEIHELHDRLAHARLPEQETTNQSEADFPQWAQGVPLSVVQQVVEYWRTGYEWRKFEDRLDQIGQHRAWIDGLPVHFLHRRSSRADAVPLLLTHGWPGSIAEFIDVIDDLTEPHRGTVPAFHVVVPSLPGFGFSGKPAESGWGVEKIAAAWVSLMAELGYPKFMAHGGDWGGVVTTILGGRFPESLIGIHTTYAALSPGLALEGLTAGERLWAEERETFWTHHAAYAKQQATRPQTIGYSLVDSPVGLLTWILDKFAEWSDTESSPFDTISLDRFLDNVTLYWFTASGASSARIYWESHNSVDPHLRVDIPTAITMYPHDISSKCPRPWAEQRFRRIVHWSEPEKGGHFPSLEVPEYFVSDLRAGLAAVMGVSP